MKYLPYGYATYNRKVSWTYKRHACSQFEKFLNDGNEWLVVFGFGQQKLLSENKGYLLFPSFKKDLHTIVQVLIEENILCDNNNRDHLLTYRVSTGRRSQRG